ncbi:glycosyltransferase family 32 protein [Paracoccus ravus]|uniref:glycosyltransferase family 32 protein n=1 Tax=Paracoccus ravus TaxID=2447760 RepID=UPI00142F7C44|nr:glycosyltransferase [Paracoccus ravus]
MTKRARLIQDIEAALRLGAAGRSLEAERALARIASDPDAALLGAPTMLGLPRKLHSALLKLAKQTRDLAAVTGLRATAIPPAEMLADLFPIDAASRAAMIRASGQPVPRILHQIWIGKRRPAPCAVWSDWASRHGWTYKLWDEQALEGIGLAADAAWRRMLSRAELAGAVDVARYHVLLREGGLYLDCDWYPIRPELGPHAFLPETGLSAIAEAGPRLVAGGSFLLANGLISTPPDHPALRRVLEALPEMIARMPEGPAWWLTGPLPFTLALRAGPFTVLDSAMVAGRLARGGELSAVITAAEKLREGPGILLEWKDW